MKKIFITVIAAAAVLTGCNTIIIEDAGRGQLTVELSASEEQYIPTSKAGNNENPSDFTISIEKDGTVVKSYDKFADMPTVIDLLSGAYTLNAMSPNRLPAAFDQPVYGASHDFIVKVGEVTSEKIVCTLQNVKVTFSLSDAFASELSSYTISVSNGDAATNKLYWTNVASEVEDQYTTKNIQKAGFFATAPLTVRVDAKRAIDGSEAYHEIIISDPKAKDHFIISLDAKVTGTAGFQVTIDESVNVRDDEEIFVPGFDEDPVFEPEDDDNPGSDGGSGSGEGDNSGDQGGSGEGGDIPANDMNMTWAGHESVNNVYPATPIDADLGEVNLIIDVPGKIAGFVVQIDSESEAFMSAVYAMTADGGNRLDLINDSNAIQAMKDVELLTGDLKGLTQVPFNLTGLLPLISVVAEPGTDHVFTLTVTDESGYSEAWKLTFSLPDA